MIIPPYTGPSYPTRSPSIPGRIGQSIANMPSNILNDMMRLGFNVGIKEPGQDKPQEVPVPYDIPAAREGHWAETGVDIGAGLVESLPLFMTGEGEAVALSKLAGLGTKATNVARLAGGFTQQGLTESPQHAAVEGGLGGLMGHVENIIPRKYRYATAGVLGAATYGARKHEGASDRDATIAASINTLLPLVAARLRNRKIPPVKETPEVVGGVPQLEYNPRPALGDVQTARTVPGTGGPIPFGGILKQGERVIEGEFTEAGGGSVFAPKRIDGMPTRNLNGEAQLALPAPETPVLEIEPVGPIGTTEILADFMRRYGPSGPAYIGEGAAPQAPAGSLIRDPIMTLAEQRRGRGVQPPPGSLIRDVTEPPRAPEPPREPVAPRAPEPPRAPRAPRAPILPEPAKAIATLQPQPPVSRGEGGIIPPEGSLIREPYYSMEEIARGKTLSGEEALAKIRRQQQPVAPAILEPSKTEIATLQPEVPTAPVVPAVDKWADARLAESRMNYAETQLWNARNGKLGRITKKGLAEYEAAAQMFREQFDQALAVAKEAPASEAKASVPPGVASMQLPEPAASLPSSLETGLENINYGDNVHFRRKFEDETDILRGTIHPGEEAGTYRLVEPDGTIHDVPPRDIITKPEASGGESQSMGTAAALQAAKRKAQEAEGKLGLPGGGMKHRSNFGRSDIGSVDPETLISLSKWVGAPAVGAVAGYAFPDDENNRLGSAIAGAALAGLLATGGHKIARRLARAHPAIKAATTTSEKASAIGTAVKEGSWSFAKAMTGNKEMARRAESAWGTATDYDKLARWVEKTMHTTDFVTRMTGKARGLANDYGDIMHTAIRALARTEDVQRHYLSLNRYFEGKMALSDLQRIVPKEVSDLAATVVQGKNGLQQVVLEGMEKGALSKEIAKSFDSYVTTSYKIFHDPAYWPTDAQINKAAQSLGKEWGTFENKLNEINNYLHEIKEGKAIWGEGTGSGKSLGAILTREKNFSPAIKDMLGEYKDPLQRMSFTGIKLVNGARTAEYFNEVARGVKPNGLKYAYGKNEWQVQLATLQSEAKLAHTPAERAIAQAKLEELQGYVRNTEGPTTGRLSNMYLDRLARDQIANYAVDIKAHTGAWGKALLEGSNYIKYNQVILSPLQLVRQVYQMPILGMAARVNPFDLAKTGKFLFDKSPEAVLERQRLRRLGVYDGASQASELRGDIVSMLDGTFDRVVKDKVSRGLRAWENAWRTPDLMVRVAAFQKQEAKLLAEYGSSQAERATNEALDFMNRYTMNYAAIPPGTKFARQLPFINQYLSFVHETARITKNLTKDAIGGDVYAIGVLGAMATAPFLIQQMTESMLSPEDNKEWQKVKNLGKDYERHNFRFVQERLPNGDFRYVSFSPLVLHDSWLQTFRATMAGDGSAAWASNPVIGWDNTPLLNLVTSVVSGRNRISGQRLTRGEDYVREIRNTVAPLLLGTDLDRIQRAITPNEQGDLGVIDSRSGKVSTLGDLLQNYITSVRPYTVRPSFLEKQAKAEALDRIRTQQSTFRAIANTNAAPEVKERARQNFENAKREILLSLQERLGATPTTAPNGQ